MQNSILVFIFLFCASELAIGDCAKPDTMDELKVCTMESEAKAGEKKKTEDGKKKTTATAKNGVDQLPINFEDNFKADPAGTVQDNRAIKSNNTQGTSLQWSKDIK